MCLLWDLESARNESGSNGSISTPDYWKYLSSSDRKAIVCGVAEDQHLTSLIDLGWNCTVTYRQTPRGESASCRCKKV